MKLHLLTKEKRSGTSGSTCTRAGKLPLHIWFSRDEGEKERNGTVATVVKFMRNASCVVQAASGSAERFQKVNRFLSH